MTRPSRLAPAPQVVDLALAAVVLTISAIDVFTREQRGGELGNLLLSLAMAAVVLRRRTGPLPLLVGAHTTILIVGVLFLADVDQASAGWLLHVIVIFAVGRYYPPRPAIAGLVVLTVAISAMYAITSKSVPSDFVFPQVLGALVWITARTLRQRARMTTELAKLAEQAREAAEADAALAQAEERRRLAREMHDVIAHSLSLMVVQAGGARMILPTDPARAAEAAGLIEETGRASLAELRSLLGVLDPELQSSGAPAPAIDDLGVLVDRAVAAGLAVELTETGARPAVVQSGVGLATYRIVQEALTNALRHAGPSTAAVALDWSRDAVAIDITNAVPATSTGPTLESGGHGLVGMAERARLYGGSFEAGPTGHGEYRVRARLRLDARGERLA